MTSELNKHVPFANLEENMYFHVVPVWLSTMSTTPPHFLSFSILYLPNNVTYGFETLQVTETLQLECGKNILIFLCNFKF
jgi:hypothetical protein